MKPGELSNGGGVKAADLLSFGNPIQFARNPKDDEPFDGSCPCGVINGDGYHVRVHCWRAQCLDGCEFSGVHVSGSIEDETKRKIAEHVRDHNGWTNSTDWGVVIE